MALQSREDHLNAAGPPASDESLAARAATLGDTAAFETLVRRHQQRIAYLHTRLTRNPAVAEELAQETFLRAWRKLAGFQGRGAFGGWLTRLAYNVFLQHLRRNRDQALTDPLDLQTGAPPPSLLVEAPSGLEPDLDRLLAVLGAEEQQLLILAYAGGLSASEIGEMLGTAPGTVKSQIHRAKEKIRRHFQIEGGR